MNGIIFFMILLFIIYLGLVIYDEAFYYDIILVLTTLVLNSIFLIINL